MLVSQDLKPHASETMPIVLTIYIYIYMLARWCPPVRSWLRNPQSVQWNVRNFMKNPHTIKYHEKPWYPHDKHHRIFPFNIPIEIPWYSHWYHHCSHDTTIIFPLNSPIFVGWYHYPLLLQYRKSIMKDLSEGCLELSSSRVNTRWKW